MIVADGVGGIGLCGLALRRVLRTEKWPYQVEIFPWGHGFLRWHADLTNAPNRDTQARLMAERVRNSRRASAGSYLPGCQIGGIGRGG